MYFSFSLLPPSFYLLDHLCLAAPQNLIKSCWLSRSPQLPLLSPDSQLQLWGHSLVSHEETHSSQNSPCLFIFPYISWIHFLFTRFPGAWDYIDLKKPCIILRITCLHGVCKGTKCLKNVKPTKGALYLSCNTGVHTTWCICAQTWQSTFIWTWAVV